MKILLSLLMSGLLLMGCSDKYDDSALRNGLNDLENRVVKLEELCKQMNTNISSLQSIVTALQKNDYVIGVTPIMQGGKEVGYTITFSQSNPITIYHGKDGQEGENGTNGKDGETPTIGVKQDADGVYYWTLNGDWLTDEHGDKIKAEGADGKDGSDGEDGADGTNGNDGITPQFKIENDYWFISYDNGTNWTQLGKATGEDGIDGEDGVGGDSMFSGVDYKTSTDYVIFTLADGTEIKLPTWSAFEALQRLCNETNTNFSALQAIVTALQNNDYITSVDPLTENGKVVGYTIKFAKSNPIVIYNGKDGADGVDGNTPVVGVKKDTDGIYYWTLDSEFIVVDGQKIKAQGTDGSDGSDGTDGVTPKLEIREGYWWISYDNGANWTQLGKATGEDGADGKDGDSIKITQDENNVYFELADGTVIMISKNEEIISPAGTIHFEDKYIQAICLRQWDINNDGNLSVEEAENITTLNQQFNLPYYIKVYNEEYLFYGNDILISFKELAYFTEVTTIGGTEFANCKNLCSIILPEKLLIIDNGIAVTHRDSGGGGLTALTRWIWGAFSNTPLTNIVIPDNVTIIGRYAFYRCNNLKTITIGKSVQNIGGYAFAHTNLQTIVCKAQIPPTLLSNAISENVTSSIADVKDTFKGLDKSMIKLYVPMSAVDTYKANSDWSGFNIIGIDFQE
ncbi:PL29 family lyase N-terminal domain-containing protein [Alistipes sp.]|uniref:PL29 family lyase N-terminal domain-containing protein n=1 Tax=Alistipes sp. TaxID=1872444 RepID=UPI003AF156A7